MVPKKKTEKIVWTRTTERLREDQLEKLKLLSWLEKSSLRDTFEDMIEGYLSSKTHLNRLIEEREFSKAKVSALPAFRTLVKAN